MPQYLIYFNQQWVGDHSEEWFQGRGPLARAVVADLKAQGALVYAGGLSEEPEDAITFELAEGRAVSRPGMMLPNHYVGGLTIIDVPDDETAQHWAARIAEACGWPQELRPFKG